MKCLTCHGLITNGNCGCSTGTQGAASVNIDTMLRDRDAEIARLKAEVAEQTARAERAEVDYRRVLSERAAANQLAGRCAQQRDHALAACAELLAALEAAHYLSTEWRSKVADALAHSDLARTDLGRGMVAVPRAVVERARKALGSHETCGVDFYMAAVADLDALLDGGKGRG